MAHQAALSSSSRSTAKCAALRSSQTPLSGRRGGCVGCKRRGQRMAFGTTILSMASSIQFIKGIKEPSVPDVKLTRAKDGSSGTAIFTFSQPSVFEASSELGDITGLYLVDDEGTLQTVDVQAKFVNGKPDRIEAKYTMRSSFEWDRFMRFMERYAEENELGFTKNK